MFPKTDKEKEIAALTEVLDAIVTLIEMLSHHLDEAVPQTMIYVLRQRIAKLKGDV